MDTTTTPDITVRNIMPGTMGTDGFGGMGGVGGLLLGTLLAGRGGLLGGYGAGYGGYGYPGYGVGMGGIGQAATGAVATDLLVNPAFQAIQSQIGTLSGTVNQNAMNDAIDNGFSNVASGFGDVNNNINSASRDVLSSIANLSTAQATGNFTTLQSINGLGRDVTAQANQNALQQLNSFNQLNTSLLQGLNSLTGTTLQGFNSQAMQTQNATNQIIAQGTANAAAMAACCCEIKEKIGADGALTRALITDNRMHDLEDALAEARLTSSQASQTNSILAALKVPPVTTIV